MHVPPDETEHSRFMRTVDVSIACDAAGIKYDWAPEHHFLTNYSHQPALECYVSFVAAKTRQIHVGFAIINITAPVNHPARTAERVATLDHLTEGRVEFGTGRGSSQAEWGGFAIPNAPPMWLACASPSTFPECGELGLGSLCFTLGRPADIEPHVKAYKAGIARCTSPVGGFVNDNIAVTTNIFCLPDGDEARWLLARARTERYAELLFQWLDSIPRPPRVPATGPIRIPAPTPQALKERLDRGEALCGSPEEIIPVLRQWEAMGVDQIIFSPLTMAMDQRHVLRSIETIGKHVLPAFDNDPSHRTTRLREAAVAARAA
jgi:alkanesulfonate monooxygenase SsuD/methylene tetrahydromethanopterin reductase-like flavin-dependent oxidoreductase (luciferase family)